MTLILAKFRNLRYESSAIFRSTSSFAETAAIDRRTIRSELEGMEPRLYQANNEILGASLPQYREAGH